MLSATRKLSTFFAPNPSQTKEQVNTRESVEQIENNSCELNERESQASNSSFDSIVQQNSQITLSFDPADWDRHDQTLVDYIVSNRITVDFEKIDF